MQNETDVRDFHQVMVSICDDFQMTHPQMIALRQRLEKVYSTQTFKKGRAGVSIKALAVLAYQRLADDGSLDDILNKSNGQLLKAARKIDRGFTR